MLEELGNFSTQYYITWIISFGKHPTPQLHLHLQYERPLSYRLQRINSPDATGKEELGGDLGGQLASLIPLPMPKVPGTASCKTLQELYI